MIMFNTTLFDKDSPDLQPFLDSHEKGSEANGWTVTDVATEDATNPFTGKPQTKITLTLDNGIPDAPPPGTT